MKKILFDINVILDVLLDRRPHVTASAAVWEAVECGGSRGLIAAHAATTIHYLIRKSLGNLRATQAVAEMLGIFEIAVVNRVVIEEALRLNVPDFEDAVTATAARLVGCDCIVSRDPKGFRGSSVRCFAPEALIPLLRRV